ncbi:MAG: hypothetical protein ACI91Z_000021 [Yoonia sp.]
MNSSISELLLWAPSDPISQIIATDFESLAKTSKRPVVLCSDKDQILAALTADDNAQLCLIYTRPEKHLAQALEQGTSINAAAADWRAQMQFLLSLYRGQRARCLVIETDHLQRYWDLGLSRLNLLPKSKKAETKNPPTVSAPAPLLQLVARSHYEGKANLKALGDELAASSINLSNDTFEGPNLLAADALAYLRAESKKAENADAENRDQIAQRDKQLMELQDALHGRTDDLSQAQAKLAEQADAMESLRVEIADNAVARDFLAKKHSAIVSDIKDVTEQNGQLSRDLQAFKGDLLQRTKDLADLSAKIAERERVYGTELSDRQNALDELHRHKEEQERHLNDQIHRIMSSRSMRMTAPMRGLFRLLGRKSDV